MNAAHIAKLLGMPRRLVIELHLPEFADDPPPHWDVRVMLQRQVLQRVDCEDLNDGLAQLDLVAPESTVDP